MGLDWRGAVGQRGHAGGRCREWALAKAVLRINLKLPGGASAIPPQPEGVLPVDFNYDFKTDIVLAGAGGVRFFTQESPPSFRDVTAETKLPKTVTNAPYSGAWAVDIEADGDLDIVMGSASGLPTVLRNNGDGTFLPIHPFSGVSGLGGFAWADVDGDGNPDAAIIDGSGHLHIFINLRQGQFRERALSASIPAIKAVAVADANNDGVLDFLVVQSDGAIVRISDKNEGQSWDIKEIVKISNLSYLAGEVRLLVTDLDNNGAFDLVLAPVSPGLPGALVWLGDTNGILTALSHPVGSPLVFAVADVNGDGRPDLLGLSADGQALQAITQASKNYHWQVVRPHAAQAVGDQRINPFGVGGEVEIRSGFLVQKLPIQGPQLHFGLGEQPETEVVRVVWPNGTVRAEFG